MVTVERLRELLIYDPETGEFRWLVKRKKVNPGDIAGSVNTKGYRNICIDKKWYGAHRLAWFYSHGEWPPLLMDHVNSNKHDNRLGNLRLATSSQNCCNRKRQSRNGSGVKGVSRRKYAWEANIMKHGKAVYLGHFKTREEAHKAYCEAASLLHGEFAQTDGLQP